MSVQRWIAGTVLGIFAVNILVRSKRSPDARRAKRWFLP
jgi:hypothetical protein